MWSSFLQWFCFLIQLFAELYKLLFHLLLATPLIFFLLLYLFFELLHCRSISLLHILISCQHISSWISVALCQYLSGHWLFSAVCFSVPCLLFSIHVSLVLISFDNCSSLKRGSFLMGDSGTVPGQQEIPLIPL